MDVLFYRFSKIEHFIHIEILKYLKLMYYVDINILQFTDNNDFELINVFSPHDILLIHWYLYFCMIILF